jgi:GNAT superfamily N-acetyltransferase
MFQVKQMRRGDFEFAADLANTMGWNMAPEDFEFNLSLEPGGCFVAFDGNRRIGVATCIGFGGVGWFGNLIVAEQYRGKGAGNLIVKHAVNYLQSKGVQTIGLYAYPNLLKFYGNLGFKEDEEFSLFSIESLGSVLPEVKPEEGISRIGQIELFDYGYFGADRKRLLESIILEKGNLCYLALESERIVGYVAATVYERMAWVGPLICQPGKTDVARNLINATLTKLRGLSVYLALPKKETVVTKVLAKAGFKEEFSVTRMYLGQPSVKNCIYMVESLERG